jgi:hypothetical protein
VSRHVLQLFPGENAIGGCNLAGVVVSVSGVPRGCDLDLVGVAVPVGVEALDGFNGRLISPVCLIGLPVGIQGIGVRLLGGFLIPEKVVAVLVAPQSLPGRALAAGVTEIAAVEFRAGLVRINVEEVYESISPMW